MSFTLRDIQTSLADSLFGGDVTIAGAIIFTALIALIFAFFGRKNIFVPFVILLPVTMISTLLGLVPTSLAILISLVSVIVIAAKGREAL